MLPRAPNRSTANGGVQNRHGPVSNETPTSVDEPHRSVSFRRRNDLASFSARPARASGGRPRNPGTVTLIPPRSQGHRPRTLPGARSGQARHLAPVLRRVVPGRGQSAARTAWSLGTAPGGVRAGSNRSVPSPGRCGQGRCHRTQLGPAAGSDVTRTAPGDRTLWSPVARQLSVSRQSLQNGNSPTFPHLDCVVVAREPPL